MTVVEQAQTVDIFLKFAYNFPMDIKDRFYDHFGQHLGEHFYNKFHGYTKTHGSNFVGMIYTYGAMSENNQRIFIEMITKYNKEVSQ